MEEAVGKSRLMKPFRQLSIFAAFTAATLITTAFIPARTEAVGGAYSPENLASFTRSLILDHEYYRAYVELQRLVTYHPYYLDPESAHISELYLMMKGGRFNDILELGVSGKGIPGRLTGIFRADAALSVRRFNEAKGLLLQDDKETDPEVTIFRWKRLYVSSLLLNNMNDAAALLEKEVFPGNGAENRKQFAAMMNWASKRHESMVNPNLALFSGIVPGLGYYTAGNRPTGIVAFVVVSIFSALAVASFKTDNEPVGVLFGAAAAFFYGGSIVGGYMTANGNNRLAMDTMAERLYEDAGLEQDREKIFEKYGLKTKGGR